MKNAFILDFNILAEQNISLKEFLTLLKIYDSDIEFEIENNVKNSLQQKQYIKLINNESEIILREKGKLLLEFLLIESLNSVNNQKKIKKSSRAINIELEDFVKKYRQLWKGLKVGSMGDENSCKEKLFRWMSENPKYSKEDIYKAAQIYLKTIDSYKYLQRADYFIYKKEGQEEMSRLSAYIEEIDSNLNDDWTTTIN